MMKLRHSAVAVLFAAMAAACSDVATTTPTGSASPSFSGPTLTRGTDAPALIPTHASFAYTPGRPTAAASVAGTASLVAASVHAVVMDTVSGYLQSWVVANGAYTGTSIDMGTVPASWRPMGSGDVNKDGKEDLVWFQASSGAVVVWLMDGTGHPTSIVSVGSAPSPWKVVGAGDYNSDGIADILWFNPTSGGVAYWYMNSNATVGAIVGIGSATAGFTPFASRDLNSDGRDDILWTGPSNYRCVWYMNASGLPGSFADIGVVPSPTWVYTGTGDVNGDGKNDIFWQSNTGTTTAWLMDGAGGRTGLAVAYSVSTNYAFYTIMRPTYTLASGIKFNVGNIGSATVNSGSNITIPLNVDMSQRGTQDIASITVTVSWDPTKLTYVSTSAGNWVDSNGDPATVLVNASNSGSGSISISGFTNVETYNSFILRNLTLQGAAGVNPNTFTTVSANVTTAGNAAGSNITVTSRNLTVTVNP